jgi:hypothetical protein
VTLALILLCGAIGIEPNSPARLRSFEPVQIAILEKLNRADAKHLPRLRQLAIPAGWCESELTYCTLPNLYYPFLDVGKVLLVHIPSQQFGAYEHGRLAYWGPVNSGARVSPTPPGLYQLNWKSRSRRSTVDPDWLMTWYWNIDDPLGIAMHAYELPGHPASHACIRLLERDAIWLYDWGERGVPVHIRGRYDFRSPPPWLDAGWWSGEVTLE